MMTSRASQRMAPKMATIADICFIKCLNLNQIRWNFIIRHCILCLSILADLFVVMQYNKTNIYHFLVQPVFFRIKTVNKNRQIYAKMTSLNIGRPILTNIFRIGDHFANRKSNKKGNLTFSVFHNIALKSICTYFFYENATLNWRRLSLRRCALLMHFKYW